MSLISCPECRSSISNIAGSCPKCGYPLAKKRTQKINTAKLNLRQQPPPLSTHVTEPKNHRSYRGLLLVGGIGFLIIVVGMNALNTSNRQVGNVARARPQSSPVDSMHPLDQAVIAFEGEYTRAQIKNKLDQALILYGLTPTEENYSRAGSALVALRESSGFSEMVILDHMIRSYVPEMEINFPSAAAISSVFLAAGDN